MITLFHHIRNWLNSSIFDQIFSKTETLYGEILLFLSDLFLRVKYSDFENALHTTKNQTHKVIGVGIVLLRWSLKRSSNVASRSLVSRASVHGREWRTNLWMREGLHEQHARSLIKRPSRLGTRSPKEKVSKRPIVIAISVGRCHFAGRFPLIPSNDVFRDDIVPRRRRFCIVEHR